jgi:cytoplasmic iron level regulating protein YaaA (DUF328/UPF0246 family)
LAAMISILSPAKTIDPDATLKTGRPTQPLFLKQAAVLAKNLNKFDVEDLRSLMGISEKLAELNRTRYRSFKTPFTVKNSAPCILAFQGDVYQGLEAGDFKASDLKFAQSHLRILSGLYGMLRPLDLMMAYRLEMGTNLKNPAGSNLYDYWRSTLTQQLSKDLASQKDRTLINLASVEYFKALDAKQLDATIIEPVFKDYKNGAYKFITFFAKKARGLMARHLILERADSPQAMKDFKLGGYRYAPKLSDSTKWVFTRKKAA